jgi:ABC-type transporter Mla maintaining outer membrane lipid asymmetry ATPase subunit MlaF
MQARVAIARALAYNPQVPFTGMKHGADAFRAGLSTDIVQ